MYCNSSNKRTLYCHLRLFYQFMHLTIGLVCGYGLLVCSPSNREPLSVRMTDESNDPVIDIADSLVCQRLAQYITGNIYLVSLFICGIRVKIEYNELRHDVVWNDTEDVACFSVTLRAVPVRGLSKQNHCRLLK